MKTITHYFRRASKSENQFERMDEKSDSTLKSLKYEDESNPDIWELYTSEDEKEKNDSDRTNKKSHLLVQVPGLSSSMDTSKSSSKRKCNSSISSRIFLPHSDPELTPVKDGERVDEEECSFYMSPLRVESDTSTQTSPSTIDASNIQSPIVESTSPIINSSSRRSRRVLISRKQLYVSMKEPKSSVDENSYERNCDIYGMSCSRIPEKLALNETNKMCHPRGDDSLEDWKSTENKDSFMNENLLAMKKVNKEVGVKEEVSPSKPLGLPLNKYTVNFNSELLKEKESEALCKSPHKLANSAFSLIMSGRGIRKTSNELGHNHITQSHVRIKKKRSPSSGVADNMEDAPQIVKRRKSDPLKEVVDVNLHELHNNLYNYFSKSENLKKVKRSKKVAQKKIIMPSEKMLPVNGDEIDSAINLSRSPSKGNPLFDRKETYVSKISPLSCHTKRTLTRKGMRQLENESTLELKNIQKDELGSTLNKSYEVIKADASEGLSLNPSTPHRKSQRVACSSKLNEHWTIKEHSGAKVTLCKTKKVKKSHKKKDSSRKVSKISDKNLKSKSAQKCLIIKDQGYPKTPEVNSLEVEILTSEGFDQASKQIKSHVVKIPGQEDDESLKDETTRSSLRLRSKHSTSIDKTKNSKISGIVRSSRLKKNTITKMVPRKSANQRMAAQIVRRACKKATLKSKTDKTGDQLSSIISEEVVMLSNKTKRSYSQKIVIKEAYVKLAPLFLAKEELRRKQVFLHSGTPEVLQKKLQLQKKLETELEERSGFPSVSHTLQLDHEVFPWNLEQKPSLVQNLAMMKSKSVQKEMENLVSARKLHLGIISDLPTSLAVLLMFMRPPTLKDITSDHNLLMSPYQIDEYAPCFCSGMSYKLPEGVKSRELTNVDVEKFARVHAWLMRSVLPPGVAFKMHVDLSSFLPLPNAPFASDQISVVNGNTHLRKLMLLKLKEDYPGFPINRWFKIFHQRRKAQGGLYSANLTNWDEQVECRRTKKRSQRTKSSVSPHQNESDEIQLLEHTISTRSTRKSISENLAAKSAAGQVIDVALSSSIPSPLRSRDNLDLQPADGAHVLDSSSHAMFSSESWTDIFAPQSYDDACILGRNLKALDKLKSWLENWKVRSTIGHKKSKSLLNGDCSDTDYSSGSEFLSSNDEDSNEPSRPGNLPTNVAVLIGQCGSGKTSSVYAIAKEMGCKVLEINASSKRSGKHILDAVKEATRSHQVNPHVWSTSPFGSFFKSSPKNRLNGSEKSKKKSATKEKNHDEKAPAAMSIIFVEDVDMVFENKDEGFISALTSLTMSSKRPFILEVHTSEPLKMGTTNNMLLQEALIKSCPHLTNLLAKQARIPLILPFERGQNSFNAEALLRITCLSEGVWVSKQWCEYIFKHSAGDFRQAIQQAHFWAGSVARATILQANKSRYPKEIIQGDSSDHDTNTFLSEERKISHHACGCKNISICSYPYPWMSRDYVKHIWLTLDQIVNIRKGVSEIGNGPDLECPSRTPFSSPCNLNPVLANLPKVTQSIAKKRSSPKSNLCGSKVSPLILGSSLRSRNVFVSKRESASSKSPSEIVQPGPCDDRLTLSCPSKFKCMKQREGGGTGCSVRRKLVLSGECEQRKEVQSRNESPGKGNPTSGGLVESTCGRNVSFCSEVLELLVLSDVLIDGFGKVKSCELGKNMVFEMGLLSNVIELSMQAGPSEKSCEIETKLAKSACVASQSQMILPLLPVYWMLKNKSLDLDLAPHVRETCRIQEQLIKTGRGRTRQSCRHPTLSRFGPSLREVLCNTLLDSTLPDNSSENNFPVGNKLIESD